MSVLTPPPFLTPGSSGYEYPVVTSTFLDTVPRRLLRLRRRHPDELPARPAGSQLVFHVHGRYALAPAGPGMLASDVVVDAEAVVAVDLRQTLVPTQVPLPSTMPRDVVLLQASFHCLVTDPLVVLQAGALQAARFFNLHSEDATGKGRAQVLDRNWVAVAQSEPPGTSPSLTTRIVLRVVKFGEPTGDSRCES